MDSQLGEALTCWSVRLAVACYLTRVFLEVRGADFSCAARHLKRVRWLWTAGCALLLVHVVCVFSFYHDWSHQTAYRHKAEQTAAIVGIHWGGGLYINYAFILFWIADVFVWWCRTDDLSYHSPGYFWTLHAVFAFMMVNATVVFGPPLWRWLAPVIILGLATVYFLRSR